MKIIPLTRGFVALVDDEDYAKLANTKWHASRSKKVFYARGRPNDYRRKEYLHHQILPPKQGYTVDHQNRNTLDCRRSNLRYATVSAQNSNSQKPRNKSHGMRGVHKNQKGPNWHATVEWQRRKIYLGTFTSPESAAHAYDIAARKLQGEFAVVNFPD